MIKRPSYVDRLKRLRGTGVVKVLTGMRRAGKSGLLRLLGQTMLEEGAMPADILLVNLELSENGHLRDAQGLLSHIRAHMQGGRVTYVLIDEAQEVEGIGQLAAELCADPMCDLYLTGSHTSLVEHRLADAMSGRYVEIPVYPLSFAEYAAAHPLTGETTMGLFSRYLQNGGLPHTLMLEDDPYALREYLDGVYHTVVRRDVTQGMGHEDPQLLDAIARRLMESLGEVSSAMGISRELSSTGRRCSDDTVARYLAALTDSYAFHRVQRLDLKTHTLLKTQEKYYADDLGLRTAMLGTQGHGLQGQLENVVYLELCRRHGTVHRAKHYGRHITFVTKTPEGRAYYEVAPSVLDPAMLDAALQPLRSERDNYPKTLLTLDEVGVGSHEGIAQRNLVEWLLAG